ncbi:MAG: DNA polymerase III subunit beta [Patescibacteria group bacterium]|nr:MAG: DNA polymerase III subunit beta [Patescibacteria group bacterium]
MTINIKKDLLKDKLQFSNLFTKSSLIQPSLGNILFVFEPTKLNIYSSNLSSFYTTSIDIKSDLKEKKEVVFDPKKLIEILSFVQDDQVSFSIDEKFLSFKSKNVKAKFPISSNNQYPYPSKIEKTLTFDTKTIVPAIESVLFSSANDDTKPVLTGINFVKHEDKLLIASTDGFRLSVFTADDLDFSDFVDDSIVLPSDFLSIVLRRIKEKKQVKLGFDSKEKLFYFGVEEDSFYTRIIDEEFPAFLQVIPENFNLFIEVDKDSFIKNIKIASVFAKDFSNIVVFDVSDKGFNIYPRSDESEGEGEVFQSAKVKGESLKIAFNFKYVLDFLNNTKGDIVQINIVSAQAPALFKIKEDKNFIHIIMPVKISV